MSGDNPFRPIAIYGPPGGQIRIESADGHFLATDDANAGRYPFPSIPKAFTLVNVFVEARGQQNVGMPGYQWYGQVVQAPPDPQNDWFLLPTDTSKNPTWWQMPLLSPSKRAPLPANWVRNLAGQQFLDPSIGPYTSTFAPLPAKNVLTPRGNFCGIRVPGAPPVPGGRNATVPGRDTDLMMSMQLHEYPQEYRDAYIQAHLDRQYTHLQRSLIHALGDLGLFSPTGLIKTTLDDYVKTSAAAQAKGLYQDHWILTGDINSPNRDQMAAYYQPMLGPILDVLIANKVVDMMCVGWQLNEFNSGESLQSVIDWLADVCGPHNIPLFIHFDPLVTWWGGVYNDRFAFWNGQKDKLSGLHFQSDVTLSVQDLQGRMNDTIAPFRNGQMGQTFGRNYIFSATELTANAQFFGPDEGQVVTSEDDGDLVGRYAMCGGADGFYNGARDTDGSAI